MRERISTKTDEVMLLSWNVECSLLLFGEYQMQKCPKMVNAHNERANKNSLHSEFEKKHISNIHIGCWISDISRFLFFLCLRAFTIFGHFCIWSCSFLGPSHPFPWRYKLCSICHELGFILERTRSLVSWGERTFPKPNLYLVLQVILVYISIHGPSSILDHISLLSLLSQYMVYQYYRLVMPSYSNSFN